MDCSDEVAALTPDLLQKMDAYWRAVNYLSIYRQGRFACATTRY
jgi:phosphoketolase